MRPAVRRALIVAGATAAGVVAAAATERYLVQRARSRPDPDADEPLAERPGPERRVTSFDGTELAVNVTGPEGAPTLVFSHGFTLDMTAWHYQWTELSAGHRCILYDHRGHGRSAPAADGDYSLHALGHDLKAVLDAVAQEGPVVLIGHSMGGMAILAFAELYPEEFGTRVAAVVLANTAAGELLKELLGGLGTRLSALVTPGLRRLLAANPRPAQRLRARALQRRSGLAFLVAEATNFGPDAPPSLIDYVVSIAAEARPEVWTDLAVSLVEMDLTEALEHVTVPALIVAAERDRLTPLTSAHAMERRLPDARLVVLEGCGHVAMLERHREFNAALREFLAQALAPQEEAAPA